MLRAFLGSRTYRIVLPAEEPLVDNPRGARTPFPQPLRTTVRGALKYVRLLYQISSTLKAVSLLKSNC